MNGRSSLDPRHGLQNIAVATEKASPVSNSISSCRPAIQIMTERWEKARVPGYTSWRKWLRLWPPAQEFEQITLRASSRSRLTPRNRAIIGLAARTSNASSKSPVRNQTSRTTAGQYYSVAEGMKIAREAIEGMTAEAEIWQNLSRKVVRIKEFGARRVPARQGRLCTFTNWQLPSQTDRRHCQAPRMKSGSSAWAS